MSSYGIRGGKPRGRAGMASSYGVSRAPYAVAAIAAYDGYGGYKKSNYDVSYDTSSKEPHMMRARVFAGNVNTFVVGREDLIGLFGQYGTMLGMTVFKGYAFIQYASPAEADYAVQCTNGMLWHNQNLDVKLAITGMKQLSDANKQPQANNGSGLGGGLKREMADLSFGDSYPKRPRHPPAFSDEASFALGNAANQLAASTDATDSQDLAPSEFPDTMICGSCRMVFNDFVQFREHRTKPCTMPEKKKPDGEPEEMQCFTCEVKCESSWGLVQHLTSRHGLNLYK